MGFDISNRLKNLLLITLWGEPKEPLINGLYIYNMNSHLVVEIWFWGADGKFDGKSIFCDFPI